MPRSRPAVSNRSRSTRAASTCSSWTISPTRSRPILTSSCGRRCTNAADCWIVYQPAQPMRLVFLQPIDYWYKPPAMPIDYWTQHFRIEVIRERRRGACARREPASLRLHRRVAGGSSRTGASPRGIRKRCSTSLHYPRARKTAYELECMRRASLRAARGHRAAEAAFRAGASEYEIHMSYVRATGQTENELPYPNIVALNATQPCCTISTRSARSRRSGVRS